MNDQQHIGRWVRSMILDLLPILTVLLTLFIVVIPFGTPHTLRVGGLWPLLVMTYWTLVRPRSMKLPIVFLLGILTDCVTFLPLGMHGFVFVLTQAIIHSQRRFLIGQGFLVLWTAFTLMAFAASLLLYILSALLQGGDVAFSVSLWSTALAAGLLPLVMWLMDNIRSMMDIFDEPV